MKWMAVSLLTAPGLWLMTACAVGQDSKLSDEDISKLLVGKWTQSRNAKGFSMKMDLKANKDGSFAVNGKIDADVGGATQTTFINMTGTWNVADGKMLMKIKTSDFLPSKVGTTDTLTVLEITDTILKTRTEKGKGKGQDTDWKRVKN